MVTTGAAGARASKQIEFAQFSVPRLLFALLHQRFSGTLTVDQPPPHVGPRTVWFRGGMPVFTNWVEPAEVLGQVLISQRLIVDSQLPPALEAMASQGGLLGHHLVAQGALDRPRLLEGLRHQCVRKLAQLFAVRSGQAWVTVGAPTDLEPDLLPLNVLGLILAGVSVAYDVPRVAAEMGAAMQAPMQATAALARYRTHFRFRPSDEPALAALSEGSRIDRMSAAAGISERRSAQLIYTLWACQMLRTGAAAEAAAPPARPAASPAPSSAPATNPAATSAASPPTAAPRTPSPASPAAPPSAAPPAVSSPAAPPSAAAPPAISSPTAPPSAAPPAVSSPTASPSAAPPASTAPVAAEPATPPSAAPPSAGPSTATEAITSDAPQDEEAFLAELAELEAKLESHTHAFALFDVPLSASKREIRKAWGDLSRKFHPDALQSQNRGHLHDRVNAVFAALSEAQQLLGDAERRQQLREAIERGDHEASTDGKDATARAHAVFQGELLAKEADKLLRANKFDRALARYREALTYNDDEPDVQAAVAWCVYQLSKKDANDAALCQDRLSGVITESPRIARAHYFLGFVRVDLGNPAAAIDSFNRASRLDQRLIDAERQARALKARQTQAAKAAAEASRGPLDGLKSLFRSKK